MAEISATRIANMSLSHIGAQSDIESLTEESPAAKECALWYDFARQQALESFDWNFARKRVAGTLHADTISTTSNQPYTGTWAFRYKYPGDCLSMRKIQSPASPPADAIPYTVELSLNGDEKTVLTNMENAVLVYTFDQEEVSLYTAGFVVAFSFALATAISFGLTGKLSIQKAMEDKFIRTVGQAGAQMQNEEVRPPPRDADWVRDRQGGSFSGSQPQWQAFPDGNN